jgi:hypothetical protein
VIGSSAVIPHNWPDTGLVPEPVVGADVGQVSP